MPISCGFLAFPAVAVTPSRFGIVSAILLLFVNGSEALAVVGRDTAATWQTLGKLRRERDWSPQRLLYELQSGRVRYRTVPEGYTIDNWLDPYLRPYLNVETSEISVPYGTECGAIVPPAPKKGLNARGVTLGIEVLPPDAEVPAPSENAPAASPAPARKVSEADLRNALRAIVEEHPPGSPPLDEESLRKKVEKRLGTELARDRILATRDEVAPHFKLPVGRPRKNAQ